MLSDWQSGPVMYHNAPWIPSLYCFFAPYVDQSSLGAKCWCVGFSGSIFLILSSQISASLVKVKSIWKVGDDSQADSDSVCLQRVVGRDLSYSISWGTDLKFFDTVLYRTQGRPRNPGIVDCSAQPSGTAVQSNSSGCRLLSWQALWRRCGAWIRCVPANPRCTLHLARDVAQWLSCASRDGIWDGWMG